MRFAVAGLVLSGATNAVVGVLDEAGRRTTTAASDPVVGLVDQSQYDLDEGPCLQAAADRAVYRIDDMTTEARWRRWCERRLCWGCGPR